ncbi:2-deoxy-D-gluconate 3-dehydrogenase [Microbispora rosea subsp. aerata]|nr:SDR family oxidoreductase [Microbispora rosea]GGO19674.1 2-deoxy-D-gluconate 3-dehydrogenase [Microbispora rosea subsp. aerata]GIH54377.1 2-deoxy-D-gluconate 3-dehydrogenase [Microbispora rosea subsp. aerata]GLJ81348.1 2-deoxy-D-gluconate 3-dehydrogenase [Microbispora rosea subsp. aerata]
MDAFLTELFSLRGRKAAITGGSSGIGKAMASALCRAGAEVVLISRRAEALREAAEEMRAAGGTASWISGDLSERRAVHRVADELLERHGTPDILINAAGVNLRPPMDDLAEDDWDLTMRLNLDAPFVLGQRLGPGMAARGWGRIINIASQQSIRAFGNSGAYGVSKAGIAALTRSQAEAWSSRGVCVNAVAPGFVRTPLTREVFGDPARSEAMARRTMIGRNGELDDFIGIAVFLAGDASAYVTGQTIFVDGGFSST